MNPCEAELRGSDFLKAAFPEGAFTNSVQGTQSWRWDKLGVISASNIKKAIAKKGSETRRTYMAELVAQIATGEMKDIDSRALEWGREHEAAARRAYEILEDCEIELVGFLYGQESHLGRFAKRVGCSPDGIVKGKNKGTEIKCPFASENFIKFAVSDETKEEWELQCQFSLWVSRLELWDLSNFDPRMKKNMLHRVTFEKDMKLHERFDNEIPEFCKEMDQMLDKLGLVYGDQWKVEA